MTNLLLCGDRASRLQIPVLEALQAYADIVSLHWGRAPVRVLVQDPRTVPESDLFGRLYCESASKHYPGLLGRHSTFNGFPQGEVWVNHCQAAGVPVSVVLSHEIAEMIVNPYGNLCVTDSTDTVWALEVCDPVEQDWVFLPDHPGVALSNFVLPSFYRRDIQRAGTRYSLDGKVKAAFTLRVGGYKQTLVPGIGWRREMIPSPKGLRP